MYCKVCGDKKEGLRIFSIYMCKSCFNELAIVSVMDENYDKYKNLVRILLSYYISDQQLLNSVN